MDKIYSFLIVMILTINVKAQIKFGSVDPMFSSESVLIEFDNNNNTSGLRLPLVNEIGANLPDGTLLYDVTTLKFKGKQNGIWLDMNDYSPNMRLNFDYEEMQDKPTGGVIIGENQTDNAIGVLVLASNDKAMVLPKIENPHENVGNPSVGMICYDTTANMLAMFDGTVWNYWE